ncbi:hypothetical protein [Komagataeibacter saccharivorans]|uniref:hypothetical protein n=1 Tax=Komagataeibacter saccharivorans TaxID=265959 RepID=UPI00215522CE|nr:hypothetical protein [Komagataeibacter saccharivorans]
MSTIPTPAPQGRRPTPIGGSWAMLTNGKSTLIGRLPVRYRQPARRAGRRKIIESSKKRGLTVEWKLPARQSPRSSAIRAVTVDFPPAFPFRLGNAAVRDR